MITAALRNPGQVAKPLRGGNSYAVERPRGTAICQRYKEGAYAEIAMRSTRLTPTFGTPVVGISATCAKATSAVRPAAKLSRKNRSFSVRTALTEDHRSPTRSRRRG